ncbi:MAG: hypothetical protein LBE36_11565 [Flavobacteriaceae bacterium]|nr:hypothetical protein [Flavobacteriaceae bacterium]
MEQLNIEEIKKHINLQKNIGSDETEIDDSYEITSKDLDLSFQVVNEGLKRNGYKFTDTNFGQFIPHNIITKTWSYAKFFDTNCLQWKNDDLFSHFPLVDRGQYIFSDNKRFFITDFFLLEEIIDIKPSNDYTIKIPQFIIARNKYLFNDSKADFVWLRFNDKDFLESLVKIFGYDKDKDLNAFVLKNNVKDIEEFGKLLWHKECSGNAKLNMGIIESITDLPDEQLNPYYQSVQDFLVEIMTKKIEMDIPFSEQAEILGKLGYYLTKRAKELDFYFDINSKISEIDGGYQRYEEEFKKNNYYNIPDFKEIWEDTKNGGIWRPGMDGGAFNDSNASPQLPPTVHLYTHPDFGSSFSEKTVKNEIEIRYTTSTGWDFVSIDGKTVGYIPTEELLKEKEEKKKKYSFLVEDEDDTKPEKKKGFWDNLLG